MTDDGILKFIGWFESEQPSHAWLAWAKAELVLPPYFPGEEKLATDRKSCIELVCRAWRVWTNSQVGIFDSSYQAKDQANQTCIDAFGLAAPETIISRTSLFESVTAHDILSVALEAGVLTQTIDGEKRRISLSLTGLTLAEEAGAPMPPLFADDPFDDQTKPQEEKDSEPLEAFKAAKIEHPDKGYKAGKYLLDAHRVTPGGIDDRLAFTADLGVFDDVQVQVFMEWLVDELYSESIVLRVPERLQGRMILLGFDLKQMEDNFEIAEYLCSRVQADLDQASPGSIAFDQEYIELHVLTLVSESAILTKKAGERIIRQGLLEKPDDWGFGNRAKEHADLARRALSTTEDAVTAGDAVESRDKKDQEPLEAFTVAKLEHPASSYAMGKYFLDAHRVTSDKIDRCLAFTVDLGEFSNHQAKAFQEWLIDTLHKTSRSFLVPAWLQGTCLLVDFSREHMKRVSHSSFLPEAEALEEVYQEIQHDLDDAADGTLNYDDHRYDLSVLTLIPAENQGERGVAELLTRQKLLSNPNECFFAEIAKERAELTRKKYSTTGDAMKKEEPDANSEADDDVTVAAEAERPNDVRNLLSYILALDEDLNWEEVTEELKSKGFPIGKSSVTKGAYAVAKKYNLPELPDRPRGRPPKDSTEK